VTDYRLVAEPQADADVAATFVWYENEQAGLGLEFLDELRAVWHPAARCSGAFLTRCTSRWKAMWSSYSPSFT
jgi:hypothetical protein